MRTDPVRVFKALADPTRQRLLDRLREDNGQPLGALCRDLGITRQGITQHLAVLEAAELITTVRRGREKLHYLNPVPLQEIYERWIAKFERTELAALSGLKRRIEQDGYAMDKPKLVHVIYIATTPERLWHALTDPELTGQYWGHRNVSGWAKGDRWEHQRPEDGVADVIGTILEVDPPRRLVHSWASPDDADNPGRHSRVTYDLEPVADAVKLTVTHEDLPSDQLQDTDDGWALVLSSLKSQLETGRPLSSLL
ncbi:ArsR/SmtB family transcription factor [Amycolatopsis anabasis]|uniref:ArsR/SmtB family transcription factor n=1 Tax=Amycolatopsis anabasis TaxID=1840409 RepID=UPI00131A6173|nr:metalloregulator ArsR/SmtB family transcription factor [Amycolatopsis anabasis]